MLELVALLVIAVLVAAVVALAARSAGDRIDLNETETRARVLRQRLDACKAEVADLHRKLEET